MVWAVSPMVTRTVSRVRSVWASGDVNGPRRVASAEAGAFALR